MPTLFAQMPPAPERFRLNDFRVERRGYLTTYSFSDGQRRWDIIERGHAVAVLPVDWRRREVYLVEQARPVKAFLDPAVSRRLDDPAAEVAGETAAIMSLETPSGMIDGEEDPGAAALRELREETGIVIGPDRLTRLRRYICSVGSMTETTTCYLADLPEDLECVTPEGDGDEHITVWRYTFDEFFAALDEGRLNTASAVILALELRRRIS